MRADALILGGGPAGGMAARLLGLALPVRRSRTAIHIDRPARRPTSPLGEMRVFEESVISRPWLANSVLGLLARRQTVADSFIGIVGNRYTPARGLALIAMHALSS